MCSRQVEQYEDSPASSGYSTESTFLGQSAVDNSEHTLHQDIETEMKSEQVGDEKGVGRDDKGVLCNANVDQGK